MTNEEYNQEKQKIYDDLVNICIRNHVQKTEFTGSTATVFYENDTFVTVSSDAHAFVYSNSKPTSRYFRVENIKLDQDFHEFVWETAKLDQERKTALWEVEQELVARKERAVAIRRLKSFAEDFKKAK